MIIVLISLFCSFIAFASSSESSLTSNDGIAIDYEVNTGLPWVFEEKLSDETHAAWKAGNSGSNEACISNLAVTVTGPGTLTLDYKFSVPASGDFYCMLYNYDNAVTENNHASVTNHTNYSDFRGKHSEWTSLELNITRNMLKQDGTKTIYFAYYRSGTSTSNSVSGIGTYVAIANVEFISGERTVTLGYDQEYGSVAAAVSNRPCDISEDGEIKTDIGASLTLTAAPAEGNRFYGWVNSFTNKLLSQELAYTFTVSENVPVSAVFAPEGTYAAVCGGTFYTESDGGLVRAINESTYNDIIIALKDAVISEDITLGYTRTLYMQRIKSYVF